MSGRDQQQTTTTITAFYFSDPFPFFLVRDHFSCKYVLCEVLANLRMCTKEGHKHILNNYKSDYKTRLTLSPLKQRATEKLLCTMC